MPSPEYVSVKAHIRKQTEKAMMIEIYDEALWIPLSQIEKWEETPDGFTKITMPVWLAKEKGIV